MRRHAASVVREMLVAHPMLEGLPFDEAAKDAESHVLFAKIKAAMGLPVMRVSCRPWMAYGPRR